MKECAAEGGSVPECHVLREKNHSAVDIWRQSPVSGDRVQFTEDGGMRRFQPSFFVPRKKLYSHGVLRFCETETFLSRKDGAGRGSGKRE